LPTQPVLPRLPAPILPRHPAWVFPALMVVTSALAGAAALIWPVDRPLAFYLPYTFLGNSLAPLPYDGYVIWLGKLYPIWLVVVLGVVGTVVIEAWNMELLGRLLARESTRGFRAHPITRWTLKWYQKAPFWSLVGTCILPIIPHYPMRVLAVLGHFPMWKYQLSVILGRGGRYTWLALLGWALHIPGKWIAVASVVLLAFAIRGARKMNRYEAAEPAESQTEAVAGTA
jgi:membrane protein YqaA with SNARE-associated domain